MPIALSDLLTPKTPDQIVTVLINQLQARGLPATSWQSGSVARTLVEMGAQTLSDLTSSIRNVAMGSFLDTASGPWLDVVASQVFGLTRNLATVAQGNITLTAAAGAGPYTVQPGQVIVSTGGGLRYRSTTGGIIPAGVAGSPLVPLTVTVKAESPGSKYNVGSGAITFLNTSLPGVTVNNDGAWLTSSGTDDETDASLRQRCRDQWSTLGTGATAASYRYWARAASPEVTRAFVQNNGFGQVTVTVAGAAGPVSHPPAANDALTAVTAYITARAPLTDTVTVQNVTQRRIYIVGTLYVVSAYAGSALAAAQTALDAWAQLLPVGGLALGAEVGSGVALALIEQQLMSVQGAQNLVLTAPSSDTVLASNALPQFDYTGLTVVGV